ncbi:MAG: FAD binding domain-containing protein [Deltaproteobacteria bacterium]
MSTLSPFAYHAPKSVKEALTLLKQPSAQALAGGTILLNALKKTKKGPAAVVSLRAIKALARIQETKTKLVLGAAATVDAVGRLPAVADGFPSLAAACRQLATTPVRHMATVGGNIACRFFWADLPAVLMTLEARLILETPSGRKEMSVDTFVTRPPAQPFLLSAVELPKRSGPSFYLRHTRTMPVDVPLMALALAAEGGGERPASVRLVLNSGVAPPRRLKKAEALLAAQETGALKTNDLAAACAEDTAGLRLDDHKRACLEADAAVILERLRRP